MARAPHFDPTDATAWFRGRIPDDWFAEGLVVRADKDEIVVEGRLSRPAASDSDGSGSEATAARSRIEGFREATRSDRMRIADAAQQRWHRHVTWAATCGDESQVFTHASVPVMTRLRFDERQVLDTLIDAGVARSRSEAMAWCVGQVGAHQAEWIDRLRDAMREVERIRAEGP